MNMKTKALNCLCAGGLYAIASVVFFAGSYILCDVRRYGDAWMALGAVDALAGLALLMCWGGVISLAIQGWKWTASQRGILCLAGAWGAISGFLAGSLLSSSVLAQLFGPWANDPHGVTQLPIIWAIITGLSLLPPLSRWLGK